MLDLHCHILPGVDDGAVDLRDSLDMARDAVAQGCRAVFATSHLGEHLFDTSAELLREEHRRVAAAVAAEGIPLEILPGAENYLGDGDPADFARRAVPLGTEGRWVLFDFSLREPPAGVAAAIDALGRRGLGAIVAHPERNLALMEDPSPLEDWVGRGALLQVNAASLLGLLGGDAREMAEWLLESRAVHVLASDAHDRGRRRFCLDDGRRAAEEIVGAEEAARLCGEVPWRIAAGEAIDPAPLRLPSRSRGRRILRRLRRLGG